MKPRKLRVEGSNAYIPLTKGYVAVIDAADVPIVDGYNWRAQECKRKDGSIRCVYAVRFVIVEGKKTAILMHRSILNAQEGIIVDHKDFDGLNNKRENIRLATRSENACNQRLRVDSNSGVRGVSFDKSRRRWRAQIVISGKTTYLGYFCLKEDAAKAYADAAYRLHGQFASLG